MKAGGVFAFIKNVVRDVIPDELKIKKEPHVTPFVSGYQDSNLGPPAPKAGALPDCATSRNIFQS